jgi:hypothetical protein
MLEQWNPDGSVDFSFHFQNLKNNILMPFHNSNGNTCPLQKIIVIDNFTTKAILTPLLLGIFYKHLI